MGCGLVVLGWQLVMKLIKGLFMAAENDILICVFYLRDLKEKGDNLFEARRLPGPWDFGRPSVLEQKTFKEGVV